MSSVHFDLVYQYADLCHALESANNAESWQETFSKALSPDVCLEQEYRAEDYFKTSKKITGKIEVLNFINKKIKKYPLDIRDRLYNLSREVSHNNRTITLLVLFEKVQETICGSPGGIGPNTGNVLYRIEKKTLFTLIPQDSDWKISHIMYKRCRSYLGSAPKNFIPLTDKVTC